MRNKKTFMRIDREVLDELRECKIVKQESYEDVVKRLLMKRTSFKESTPMSRELKLRRALARRLK